MLTKRQQRRTTFIDAIGAFAAVLAVGFFVALSVSPASAQPKKKQPPPKKKQPAGKKAGKKKSADEEVVYPKISELLEKLPTVEQLLKEDPVDWVVLHNNDALIVLPVTPRPKTLEKIEQRVEESKKWPRPATKEEQEAQEERRRQLRFLYVNLKEGGAEPLRRIHYRDIKQIVHHEDQLLLRIGKLQDEGDLALAFELLFNLKREKPGWPGIDDYEKRQLLTEARKLVKEKQLVTALVRLEELFDRDNNYEGTSELFGQVVDRLAEAALKTKDYRKARHYLGRLAKRIPTHGIFEKHRDELQKQAEALLAKATASGKAGRHDVAESLVRQAVDVWPDTPQLQAAFEAFTRRFQRLRVGVRRMPDEASPYFLPTLADERIRFLTQTPLFEPESAGEVVHFQTRYFSDWLPTDLGRLTVFQLQSNRPYWLPQPVVTAADIARNLQYRMDPNSPEYDERLTSYIRSVRVDSPTKLQIRFSRVPPRFESILQFPLRNTDEWRAGSRKSEVGGRKDHSSLTTHHSPATSVPSLISPRFTPHELSKWTPDRRVYRRSRPEPDGVVENQYHVAEVEEWKFAGDARAIQALKRGQIDVLAHVHPFDKPRLDEDRRLAVREYALPVTHVLQFNPESAAVANREFRRALAYALDRQGMLKYLVLRTQDGGDPGLGRVVSAPYYSQSYAYNPTVEPKKYDIALAMALTIAVRKQYERAHEAAVGVGAAAIVVGRGAKRGWIPKLKMLVAPGQDTGKVAENCVRQWGRLGIKVEIVTAGKLEKGKHPQWDIVYRTAKMVDPVVDLWPFLTLGNRARVAELKQVPDWLRQELIDVDLARDWTTAVANIHQLHRHLADETQTIPLFEVKDFIAFRREVTAFRSEQVQPVSTYHDVERWSIRRTYPPNFP